MSVLTSSAFAAETLRFKEPSTYKHNLVIKHVLLEQNQNSFDYQIAEIDLNNDFITEYVVRPSLCIENNLCAYHLIALPDHNPLSLGHIKAYKITFDYSDLYGVRNVRAYLNQDNNFRYALLQWDPFSYKYKTVSEQ